MNKGNHLKTSMLKSSVLIGIPEIWIWHPAAIFWKALSYWQQMLTLDINGQCNISYIFIFLVIAFYTSLSKIVGVINVDPLNRASNPKIAMYSFLEFHTQWSKSS